MLLAIRNFLNAGGKQASQNRKMVVGNPVRSKRVISLWNILTLALVSFVVFFPYESNAQRAALGIGSKLKGRFGRSTTRPPRSRKATQGEQENDNHDYKPTLVTSLWTIATEKKGIVGTMIAILCGYIYLILQQSKIQELEKAIAGGEFRILSYRLVTKRNLKEMGFFFLIVDSLKNIFRLFSPICTYQKRELSFRKIASRQWKKWIWNSADFKWN